MEYPNIYFAEPAEDADIRLNVEPTPLSLYRESCHGRSHPADTGPRQYDCHHHLGFPSGIIR